MSVAVTCGTIALALAGAKGGETFSLKNQVCERLTIAKTTRPAKQVTVNAGGSTVRSLRLYGANIRWRSGTYVGIAADAVGADRYGVYVRYAANIRLEGLRVTAARKGVVVDESNNVTVSGSTFDAVYEDGLIISRTSRIVVANNVFKNTVGKPTECETAGGIVYGKPARDCVGGVWRDGYHNDAVQMFNDVHYVTMYGNRVTGVTQGLTLMDTDSMVPLTNIVIRNNYVNTDAPHKITLYGPRCTAGCRIENNTGMSPPGSVWKPYVLYAAPVTACGNVQAWKSPAQLPCG